MVTAALFETGKPARRKGLLFLILALVLVTGAVCAWRFFIIAPLLQDNSMLTRKTPPVVDQQKPGPGAEVQIQEPVGKKDTSVRVDEPVPGKSGEDPAVEEKKIVPAEKVKKPGDAVKKTVKEKPSPTPAIVRAPPVDPRFYEKALSYHRTNDLETAIRMYEEILDNNPEFDEARFNLAAACIQQSMFDKACSNLKKLREKNPENTQVLLNLAIAEIGMGMPDKAISHLEMAEAKTNSPDFQIYFHRGVAYSKLNRFGEAIAWYKRARKIAPQNPSLLLNMGIAHERMKAYGEAVAAYELSLKYGDTFPPDQRDEITRRVMEIRRFLAERP